MSAFMSGFHRRLAPALACSLLAAASAFAADDAAYGHPAFAADPACLRAAPPATMRGGGHSGATRVRFHVRADGRLEGVDIVQGSGDPLVDDAVRHRLGICRFVPAADAQGQPVAGIGLTTMGWTADGRAIDRPPPLVDPTGHVTRFSETEVRAAWDRAVADFGTEYRVRHVLVATKAEADRVLTRLRAGERFEDLARTLSGDPESGRDGGTLNWGSRVLFPDPFADAVVALAPKGLAPEPVQTAFGWHVIELLEVRAHPLPAFERVHDRALQSLQDAARSAE